MDVAPRTPVEEKERPVDDTKATAGSDSDCSQSDEEDTNMANLLGRLAIAVQEEQVLTSLDLRGIAEQIKAGKTKNIIVMAGAGTSVSAGIPDFRSPGTGLYDNLEKLNLPRPEAVFDIDFFRENPRPFYTLAKELYPGSFCPTITHCFILLLHIKGLLLRCYTQNIDSLEVLAGLPEEKVIAAHGNFDKAHCIGDEKHEVETGVVKAAVEAGVPAHCEKCGALLKPDIVFFGEALPQRFFSGYRTDFPACDMLIVIGTSLVVFPFASLVGHVGLKTPRLLINRERVAQVAHPGLAMAQSHKFNFGEGNYRDVFHEGLCDEGCEELAALLGWGDDLSEIVLSVRGKFPDAAPPSAPSPPVSAAPANATCDDVTR